MSNLNFRAKTSSLLSSDTLFEKSNFCPKIQFWPNSNIFTSFSWNQSCQQLKSQRPQHFHEFFTQKKIDKFLGKSKLNFWTKDEDFERWSTLLGSTNPESQSLPEANVHRFDCFVCSRLNSKYQNLNFLWFWPF